MGLGTALLVAGTTLLVVGPKQLPAVARQAGYALGRSLAFARSARNAVRDASKDPEVAAMAREVEKGLEDMRRIRDEIQSLSAQRAVPYILAEASGSKGDEESASNAPAVAAAAVASAAPLPQMPPVPSRMYSPAHTDRIEVAGGADLLIEAMQQSDIARSWRKKAKD
jgi:Sec-independent protein translocase protein TatA